MATSGKNSKDCLLKMEKIKILLEKREELEDIRKSLVSLLDISLGILKGVANKYGQGYKLHKAVEDYGLIYKISKNFLSGEELGKIEERHEEIQEIWAPRHTKNEKKI